MNISTIEQMKVEITHTEKEIERRRIASKLLTQLAITLCCIDQDKYKHINNMLYDINDTMEDEEENLSDWLERLTLQDQEQGE